MFLDVGKHGVFEFSDPSHLANVPFRSNFFPSLGRDRYHSRIKSLITVSTTSPPTIKAHRGAMATTLSFTFEELILAARLAPYN